MRLLDSLVARAKTIRIIRFVLVGTLNTSFSYLVYACFLYVGLGYQLANLLSLLMGIVFSFKTLGHLVFHNPDNRLLGRFVLTWAVIYMCAIALIGRLMAVGFDAYVAGALILPVNVALSYLAQKYFVFRQSRIVKSAADRV